MAETKCKRGFQSHVMCDCEPTHPLTPREKVEQAVKDAIREDASVGLQMTLTPRFMRGLVDRVLSATSVVDHETGIVSDKSSALATREDAQPVAVIAFREGRREPELLSWNALPVGEHRLYTRPAPDAMRVAVEALEFYADEEAWVAYGEDAIAVATDENVGTELGFDSGEKARQALAALQAEQGAK